jgi:hypothetical protein
MKNIKNKKLLIISSLASLTGILIIGFLIIGHKNLNFLNFKGKNTLDLNTKNSIVSSDFLSILEKKDFGIDSGLKIKALKRNSSGRVVVYKIISNEPENTITSNLPEATNDNL